jgi:uncharacterized protein with von Willebrand factor type A (vWA) domain
MSITKNQKDFNTELDTYLSKRKGNYSPSFFKRVDDMFSKTFDDKLPRINETSTTVYGDTSKKRSWFSSFSRKKKTSDLMEEEIIAHESELSPSKKAELEELEHEVEDIEEESEVLETQKQTILGRFFASLFAKKQKDLDDEFDAEVDESQVRSALQEDPLKDETRIVLKSLHKWISRLPPDQIEAFKRSPDFEQYKDLLDRYGLIR